jgi:glycerol transport system permease protein
MMHSIPGRRLILSLFLIFLLLPIYWLVNMSLKTNYEIVTTMTLWPHQPTIANTTCASLPTRAGIPATSIR